MLFVALSVSHIFYYLSALASRPEHYRSGVRALPRIRCRQKRNVTTQKPVTMTLGPAGCSAAGLCRVDCGAFSPWLSSHGSALRGVGRFNPEQLCVLTDQSLKAAELPRLRTNRAADRSSAQKVVQNIERNVPSGGAHRDEAAIDAGPQRQARAATQVFQFPPHRVAAPGVLKQPGSVRLLYYCFCNVRRGRSRGSELHPGSNRTQAPIGVKGRPLAQMLRI